jgi:DNA-binding ferritin-like protein
MEKCQKVAALYVATLRAIAIVHQQNHWTTRGLDFYGDHLLFERLYDAALENLDSAAERVIGLFGAECLDYTLQVDFLNKVLDRYKKIKGTPEEISLAVEKDFLNFAKEAYNCWEDNDKLTMGLDDLATSISSKSEEACYLLQQALTKK